ncbi:MAG: hypothetical protein CM15mP58_22410 [Burkholderiaceae bacterium]|nr:MAG: hypothetical protein CM15mP58_22410 [Burkholderiaceae bacterium]
MNGLRFAVGILLMTFENVCLLDKPGCFSGKNFVLIPDFYLWFV